MATYPIEWSEVWIDQMKRHNEMNGGMDCAAYWDSEEEARNYWRMIERDGGEYVKVLLDKITIKSTYRVLDIGSGPGPLAIHGSKGDHASYRRRIHLLRSSSLARKAAGSTNLHKS